MLLWQKCQLWFQFEQLIYAGIDNRPVDVPQMCPFKEALMLHGAKCCTCGVRNKSTYTAGTHAKMLMRHISAVLFQW